MKAVSLSAAVLAAMGSCVIPVGASAAIVGVAPPEYYTEAGAIGGIWSDSPESISFDGPPYGAFAGSSAGVAGVNFVATNNPGPNGGAVNVSPIAAEMRYVFEVLGTPGEPVLVHVEFAGYAFDKTVLVDNATSASAYASAEGTVNGHTTIFCASIPSGGCPVSPPVSNPAPVDSPLDALSYDTTSFYAIGVKATSSIFWRQPMEELAVRAVGRSAMLRSIPTFGSTPRRRISSVC
jgi:hypothetical protein